jgi:hypothetical protein
MSRASIRFPLWTIIAISVVLVSAVIYLIITICYYNKHGFGEGSNEALQYLAIIHNIIIYTVLITANILLVGITQNYSYQTARMAEETKKMTQETEAMVKHHERRWQIELQPLFVPITYDSNDDSTLVFRFRNFGNLALFVQCGIRGELCDEHKYVESGGFIEIRAFDMDKLISGAIVMDTNNPDESIMTWITIDFQDKLANKYRQIFEYYFRKNKWDFDFNESSLPKEKTL